jgi:hypothetical protein
LIEYLLIATDVFLAIDTDLNRSVTKDTKLFDYVFPIRVTLGIGLSRVQPA